MNGWQQSGRMTVRSSVLLTKSNEIKQVLVDDAAAFRRESGFFRIGRNSLDLPSIQLLSSRLLDALRAHASTDSLVGQDLYETFGAGSRRGLRLQSWGHCFMREYFRLLIHSDRPASLTSLVTDYVENGLVPDDIEGRRWFPHSRVTRVRRAFAKELETAAKREPAKDLVDVVLGFSATKLEQAELLQRLIVSVVGFTGSALEWCIYNLPEMNQDSSTISRAEVAHFVLETLRLYPVAWRLTRTAETSLQIEDTVIAPGDTVMLNIFATHRNSDYWSAASQFLPSRWDQEGPRQGSYLPFGGGKGMCPARNFATLALVDAVAYFISRYELIGRPTGGQPQVLTLLAPPKGYLVVERRSDTPLTQSI